MFLSGIACDTRMQIKLRNIFGVHLILKKPINPDEFVRLVNAQLEQTIAQNHRAAQRAHASEHDQSYEHNDQLRAQSQDVPSALEATELDQQFDFAVREINARISGRFNSVNGRLNSISGPLNESPDAQVDRESDFDFDLDAELEFNIEILREAVKDELSDDPQFEEDLTYFDQLLDARESGRSR
jgi:hypothetical protein